MGSITISDWLIILATISGPILAVQAQKFIERARARHDQRLSIFYRLMAYRATQLAPERIQALNMIDLEFRRNRFGRQSSKDMAVTTAWKNLLDELNGGISDTVTDPTTIGAWQRRCDDLSVDLLFALSKALGYEFSKVELKRGIYYPRGHVAREASQNSVLANLEKLLARHIIEDGSDGLPGFGGRTQVAGAAAQRNARGSVGQGRTSCAGEGAKAKSSSGVSGPVRMRPRGGG
jgi:hypothetical protein